MRLSRERADRVNECAHRAYGVLERGLLVLIEGDFDDALDPARADDGRHTDVEAVYPVFAVEPGGTGQDALPCP